MGFVRDLTDKLSNSPLAGSIDQLNDVSESYAERNNEQFRQREGQEKLKKVGDSLNKRKALLALGTGIASMVQSASIEKETREGISMVGKHLGNVTSQFQDMDLAGKIENISLLNTEDSDIKDFVSDIQNLSIPQSRKRSLLKQYKDSRQNFIKESLQDYSGQLADKRKVTMKRSLSQVTNLVRQGQNLDGVLTSSLANILPLVTNELEGESARQELAGAAIYGQGLRLSDIGDYSGLQELVKDPAAANLLSKSRYDELLRKSKQPTPTTKTGNIKLINKMFSGSHSDKVKNISAGMNEESVKYLKPFLNAMLEVSKRGIVTEKSADSLRAFVGKSLEAHYSLEDRLAIQNKVSRFLSEQREIALGDPVEYNRENSEASVPTSGRVFTNEEVKSNIEIIRLTADTGEIAGRLTGPSDMTQGEMSMQSIKEMPSTVSHIKRGEAYIGAMKYLRQDSFPNSWKIHAANPDFKVNYVRAYKTLGLNSSNQILKYSGLTDSEISAMLPMQRDMASAYILGVGMTRTVSEEIKTNFLGSSANIEDLKLELSEALPDAINDAASDLKEFMKTDQFPFMLRKGTSKEDIKRNENAAIDNGIYNPQGEPFVTLPPDDVDEKSFWTGLKNVTANVVSSLGLINQAAASTLTSAERTAVQETTPGKYTVLRQESELAGYDTVLYRYREPLSFTAQEVAAFPEFKDDQFFFHEKYKDKQEHNQKLGMLRTVLDRDATKHRFQDMVHSFVKITQGDVFGTAQVFGEGHRHTEHISTFTASVIGYMESYMGKISQFTKKKGGKFAGGVMQVNMKYMYPGWDDLPLEVKLELGRKYEKDMPRNLVQGSSIYEGDAKKIQKHLIKMKLPIKNPKILSLINAMSYNGGQADSQTIRNLNSIMKGDAGVIFRGGNKKNTTARKENIGYGAKYLMFASPFSPSKNKDLQRYLDTTVVVNMGKIKKYKQEQLNYTNNLRKYYRLKKRGVKKLKAPERPVLSSSIRHLLKFYDPKKFTEGRNTEIPMQNMSIRGLLGKNWVTNHLNANQKNAFDKRIHPEVRQRYYDSLSPSFPDPTPPPGQLNQLKETIMGSNPFKGRKF